MDTEQDSNAALETLQAAHRANPYPSVERRQEWLDNLKTLLLNHRHEFEQTISEDFNYRPATETELFEILPCVSAIHYQRKRIKRWMKPVKRLSPLTYLPGKSRIHHVPLGVVGVIVPWNYPLFSSLGPVISALAAGNRALIKMSEFTPKTGRLLQQLCRQYLGPDVVAVINGGLSVSAAFARLPFDHLVFTGSSEVGRLVMAAAAQNLTPVTLELGGKSPVIISRTISASEAAVRLVWPKTLNNGQSCTAPDYIFCPEESVAEFIAGMRKEFSRQYPDFKNNPDRTSIIHQGHYDRLQALLSDAQQKGATLIPLQDYERQSEDDYFMPLTLITGVTDDMAVMQSEIFGPLLPVLSYQGLPEVYDQINAKPHPLALYFFGYDKAEWQDVGQKCPCGTLTINDATLFPGNDALPFGGVGESGMGAYHEHEGFVRFSNAQGFFERGKWALPNLIAAPPYKRQLPKLLQKLFIR